MQSGWRLYAVMIALAALTGTIVALALSGGPRLPSEGPRASATATVSASASESRLPSSETSPTPSATPSPMPSATPSDPLLRIRPLVFAWRPTETTAIVEKWTDSGIRLIAVPLSGGAVTPLVDLPSGTQWSMRLDGSAIAMTVTVGDGASAHSRIAALNLQTGAIGWVTPDEPSASHRTPLWSNDGSVIYYARSSNSSADEDIDRIRVDGTNLTQLRAQSKANPASVLGITPDGLGLQIAGNELVDILDLSTRAIRSYGSTATGARPIAIIAAWRPQRPRALVETGGPAGGLDQLLAWDDLAPTATPVVLATQTLVSGADWDTTATRVVAALTLPGAGGSQLVTMDADGKNRTTIVGTEGASDPYWLRAGIVYLYSPGSSNPTEIRIAQPSGTASPRTLYSDTMLMRLSYVSP